MRSALLLAALLLAAPFATIASAVAPTPVPLPPEIARADPDGGTTLMTTLDDGAGGVWRELPLSDAGLASFTNALAASGVEVDPVLYGAELRETGVYVHGWSLEGTPYVTLGVYLVADSVGKLRVPVLIVENVSDLQGAADFAASLVADDAAPVVAEAIPHAYGLAAPDAYSARIAASLAIVVLDAVASTLVPQIEALDAVNGVYNLPSETYPALRDASVALQQLSGPLVYGQFGVGGTYADWTGHNLSRDWIDRPDVRVWTARKAAAGHEVWTGVAIERTGASEGDGVASFDAWKRIAVGPATRIDGATSTPAAVYARADVSRRYQDDADTGGATSVENHMTITVGLAAAGADTPLARVQMDETRADSGDEGNGPYVSEQEGYGIEQGEATYLPESQRSEWSAGPVVAGSYVPLVGARTDTRHHGHADHTNLGDATFEWESERVTSAGVYVAGEYTPLVGARAWTERLPLDLYATLLPLNVGSQDIGDAETSVGTFVVGEYTALAGSRYDDDFDQHLHPFRGMLSAGAYALEAYQPIVGVTYDGEQTLLVVATSASAYDMRWQTSVGSFTLGYYRPVLGSRFVPASHDQAYAQGESHQVGIYPLNYDPFIPVASVDYTGEATSLDWVLIGQGDWNADVVAYTPGPYAFPLAGAAHREDAPDGAGADETHVFLGAYGPEGFVPLAGASYYGEPPVEVVLSLVTGGSSHGALSVGHYANGAYTPVATLPL